MLVAPPHYHPHSQEQKQSGRWNRYVRNGKLVLTSKILDRMIPNYAREKENLSAFGLPISSSSSLTSPCPQKVRKKIVKRKQLTSLDRSTSKHCREKSPQRINHDDAHDEVHGEFEAFLREESLVL